MISRYLVGICCCLLAVSSLAADLDFGTMDFTGTPSGNVTIGTNNTLSYPGGVVGDNSGQAATIDISGTVGQIVDIACSSDSFLSVIGVPLLTSNHEIVIGNNNVTNFGGGTSCHGLTTTSISHTIGGAVSVDRVYLGAQLDTSGANLVSGTFSSQNLGGIPVRFRLTYQ